MDATRVLWELEQRRLITETLQDYCTFVDQNDPEMIAMRVFAPGGEFELAANQAVSGREKLTRMFTKILGGFAATSHHLSNVRITLEGQDRAHATAYVYAWHRMTNGDRVEAWGRYSDDWVLLEEGWRIQRRVITMAGTDGLEGTPFQPMPRLASPTDLPSPTVTRR